MLKLTVKIISSTRDQIIGWKGEVLEINLRDDSAEGLSHYLEQTLGMPGNAFLIEHKEHNIYMVTIQSKYSENLEILLT
jgi:hypothetical protein